MLDDVLNKMERTIDSVRANKDHWTAWREPVLEQARQIEALVRLHPKKQVHHLDRPGITIAQSAQADNERILLFMDVPGYPSFFLKFDPAEGISIGSEVVIKSLGSGVSTEVLAVADLEHSWMSQSGVVQSNWPSPFEAAQHALSCVYQALQNNSPLGAVADWPMALHEIAARPAHPFERADRWAHWVETWGTPEMVRDLHIVDDLFDFEQDPILA